MLAPFFSLIEIHIGQCFNWLFVQSEWKAREEKRNEQGEKQEREEKQVPLRLELVRERNVNNEPAKRRWREETRHALLCTERTEKSLSSVLTMKLSVMAIELEWNFSTIHWPQCQTNASRICAVDDEWEPRARLFFLFGFDQWRESPSRFHLAASIRLKKWIHQGMAMIIGTKAKQKGFSFFSPSSNECDATILFLSRSMLLLICRSWEKFHVWEHFR